MRNNKAQKQQSTTISYLKTLAEQAHKPLPKEDLTKAEASELIDTMRQKAGLEK